MYGGDQTSSIVAKTYKRHYKIMIGEQNANLMLNLWDTMGSDHLASMRKQDYEDCTVCVLTYDIS